MPELPEVETIARALREGGRNGPSVMGQRIAGVEINWLRTLATPDVNSFLTWLPGQTIQKVFRRGKFLLFGLDHGFLITHLRMSGDIRVEPEFDILETPIPLQPHDRIIYHFLPHSGRTLRMIFNDARKFGRVWLVEDPEEVTGLLGPEPLSNDFTQGLFYDRLQSVNRQIKPLLLDQSFLAGLGNIYTDEALYLAQIHPLRISSTLAVHEAGNLWQAIQSVLLEGIRRNGASFDWVYRGGEFQNTFQVYQRTGEPCYRCGTPINRILVGQRSSHYCPVCQVQT